MSASAKPSFLSSQVLRGIYLVTDPGGVGNTELEVVCAGWEECAADYRIERNDFPYYAVEYIAAGEWELATRDGKRPLGPGAVFGYGPGVSYRLRPLGASGLSKYFVDFTGSSALSMMQRASLRPGGEGMVLQHRWLRELFDQLIETRQFPTTVQRRLSRLTLELILARLPEHLREGEGKTQAAWVAFERCRSYLSENYLSVTSLAVAARACGVSPAYLSRLFARFSNESPKVFLDRMKMNHAAQKLLRGDTQVKGAAAEVGYADVFHFSRVFKKRFGVPPSIFARNEEVCLRSASVTPSPELAGRH